MLTVARPRPRECSTGHYVRFERVASVAQTDYGLLADVHAEQLRIDLVRPQLVRVKISRGGTFDESPTSAVYTDPLAEPVDFSVVRDADRVRLVTRRRRRPLLGLRHPQRLLHPALPTGRWG